GAALAGRMLGGPVLRARPAAPEPGREPPPRLPSLPSWLRWPRRRRLGVPALVLAAGLACFVQLLRVAAASPPPAPLHRTTTPSPPGWTRPTSPAAGLRTGNRRASP